MNKILTEPYLTWPEKLGALAYLFKQHGTEALCPVTHRFEPGMYIREMFVPRGTYFIGRAHRIGHRITLDAGRVRFITEGRESILEAPAELTTVPCFITVVEALDDVWASTYHPNPTGSRNIDALEADIFFPQDDLFRIGEPIVAQLYPLLVAA